MASDAVKELKVVSLKPPLIKDATALVLIDMILGDTDPKVGLGTVVQNPHLFGQIAQKVIPNAGRLLAHFRTTHRPIVHVRVVSHPDDASDWPKTYRSSLLGRKLLPSRPGVKGYEWVPSLAPRGNEIIVEKRSISAFNSTGIESILHRLRVEDIAILGVTTNYGVGHAAIDAADRGFGVVVVKDATAAYSQATHDEWLAAHEAYYFRSLTTDEVIAELS
jgi:nicotinamidase-related amidase